MLEAEKRLGGYRLWQAFRPLIPKPARPVKTLAEETYRIKQPVQFAPGPVLFLLGAGPVLRQTFFPSGLRVFALEPNQFTDCCLRSHHGTGGIGLAISAAKS